MTRNDPADRDRRDFVRFAGSGLAIIALAPGPRLAGAQAPAKIGMIGAGRQGSALGALLVKAGTGLCSRPGIPSG